MWGGRWEFFWINKIFMVKRCVKLRESRDRGQYFKKSDNKIKVWGINLGKSYSVILLVIDCYFRFGFSIVMGKVKKQE